MFDYYLHLHFRSRWRLGNGCWWSEMPLGALNFRSAWCVPQRLLTLVCHQEMLCAQLLSHVQLCDPMDCNLPGSSVHEISQARLLEWVAISFSSRSSRPNDQTHVSCLADRFFTTSTTWEHHHQEILKLTKQVDG